MKKTITQRDKQLIEQVLKYNVSIAKTAVSIYKEIDNNISPNFAKIKDLLIEIKSWIKQIEILRNVIRERDFDPNGLVSAYLYDTETLAHWLEGREKHIEEVRQKVYNKRQPWIYTTRDTLTYTPDYWLDPSAIQLAAFFKVGLG